MALPKTVPPGSFPSDDEGFVHPAFGGEVAVKYNTVAYTDTAAKTLFTLPQGAVIIDYFVDVTTAFNDLTTDVLDVGTSVDPDAYVDALDVSSAGRTLAGAGATMPITNLFATPLATDTVIQGIYTGGTADATAGVARIVLVYIRK